VKVLDEHTARVLRDHFEGGEHDPNAPIQPKRSNGRASGASELRYALTAFGDVHLREDRPYLVKDLLPKRGVTVL